MKVKVFLILVGVAALHLLLIAGFAITGGCKGPEIFADRRYIPAEAGESSAAKPEAKPEVKPEPVKPEAVKPLPVLPPEKPVAAPKTTHAKPVAAGSHYTVQSGDTLGKIAKRAGVSVSALAAANNMSAQKTLRIGQTLVIPGGSVVAATAPAHKPVVKKKNADAKKDTKAAKDVKKEEARPEAATADGGSYTVKHGDNIWTIAKKLKVKATELAKANNLSTKANLKIGQKLVVPGAKKSEAAPEATAETKKADAATDEILKNVADPTSTAPVDASSTTPAPAAKGAVAPSAAPAASATAPAAAAAPVAPISKTDTVEVSRDIEIGKFAQQYGVKVDDIKKLNNDLPKDGILKAGKIVIIPSAE